MIEFVDFQRNLFVEWNMQPLGKVNECIDLVLKLIGPIIKSNKSNLLKQLMERLSLSGDLIEFLKVC